MNFTLTATAQLSLSAQQVRTGHTITGTLTVQPSNVSVTLTSSTNRGTVTFNNTGSTTATVGAGSITIHGATTSTNLNDVTISASGSYLSMSAQTLTVFTVTGAFCTPVPVTPANYAYQDSNGSASLKPTGDTSIEIQLGANAVPSSVSTSSLQLGLVQNVESCTESADFNAPYVVWNSNAVVGTTYTCPSDGIVSWSIPVCDDVGPGASPPYYGGLGAFSSNPYQVPDGPTTYATDLLNYPLVAADGTTIVGTALYPINQLSMVLSFSDWCALLDSTDNTVQYPASGSWACLINRYNLPAGPTASAGPGGSPNTITAPTGDTLVTPAYTAALMHPGWTGTASFTR